jgi:hypothetical protein
MEAARCGAPNGYALAASTILVRFTGTHREVGGRDGRGKKRIHERDGSTTSSEERRNSSRRRNARAARHSAPSSA